MAVGKHDKEQLVNGVRLRHCNRCERYLEREQNFGARKYKPTTTNPMGWIGFQSTCKKCLANYLKEYRGSGRTEMGVAL